MQSHNRSLSAAMISHDLQEWLTRTSAEQPAPLPTCCCEQLTCRSSELFKDTIKRLEGESRLAAEIGQSLLLKYEKCVHEDEQRRREYEQKLQKAEEKIKKLRKINDDLEKHNEELTLKNNKSNWEYEKAQQTIQSMSADLEVTNHKLEKLTADNESKDAEIEKTRILRMLTRQADLRDEMNESKIGDLKQELALARKNELFLESKHRKLASRYVFRTYRINIPFMIFGITEILQTNFDALKQENAALAEAAENGSNAGWIRKVNDKLKNIEMKNGGFDVRPQQYQHLITLIKELGFSNNKLKNELAEYKDMLSDSKAEVTLLNAKLEQLEGSDDSELDSTVAHKQSNMIPSRNRVIEEEPESYHVRDTTNDSQQAYSLPYDNIASDNMRTSLKIRRSATAMRTSDKPSVNRLATRTLTTPLYADPANTLSSSSLSSPSDNHTVVHHHYHYHVHKSKSAYQDLGLRRLRKETSASDGYISEEQNQKSLVSSKSIYTTDISKPVVNPISSTRSKSLLSSSLHDLSKKKPVHSVASSEYASQPSSWTPKQTEFNDRTLKDVQAIEYHESSETQGVSLCKDAPYHSLHHLGTHYYERLKATDIRALNRQLRRTFDILELSSMSNSIIDNVLADIRVLKTRFLWVEQSITTYRNMVDADENARPWESDVSMDDFFPLVELTEILLSEIGQMRMTLNDLQVEYVSKVEQIGHRSEQDVIDKRRIQKNKSTGPETTFSWFTNILSRYNTKDNEPMPVQKRHKRTVSHESITSQLMERMEGTEEETKPSDPMPAQNNTRAKDYVEATSYLSNSVFGSTAFDTSKLLKSSATLIPRASKSTGTLRKAQKDTPKSSLRQYIASAVSENLTDYYSDDSRPTSPDIDWKIANGIGTRRYYK
ncbi:hypothetical protein NQZ79_g2843 [Umbelopsis isabellina]|nr:hypothetical protein NQZ79_g2843 [Umbelopsis isabellina]